MLSQALIKTLLESPLPLRLALLDADPEGAGWALYGSLVQLRSKPYGESLRNYINADDGAWLPCNPLAIVEHAARILDAGEGHRHGIERETNGEYTAFVTSREDDDRAWKYVQGPCPHTAAVALLREVVG